MYFYKYQTKSQHFPIQNPIVEFKKVLQKVFKIVLSKRMPQKQVEVIQNSFQKQNSNPIIN
jgi:hypothetical protein